MCWQTVTRLLAKLTFHGVGATGRVNLSMVTVWSFCTIRLS